MPFASPRRRRVRVLFALLLGYGVQLLVVGYMWLVPQVAAEDAHRRYVVSRYTSAVHFLPLLGVVPFMTGEPVRLELTDKASGVVTVSYPDLAIDAASMHPTAARAMGVTWPDERSGRR